MDEPQPPVDRPPADGRDGEPELRPAPAPAPAVDPDGEAGGDRAAAGGAVVPGERRRRRRRSSVRNAVEWVAVLGGALLVAWVVQAVWLKAFYIPSESMQPALQVNDRVLVNQFSYDVEDVDRGDLIVFQRPENAPPDEIDDLIKRVVGLPGETVENRDGVIYVDGEELDEPYLADGTTSPAFSASSGCVPSCTIGEDEVFVLGDNRGNSSASNVFGPVDFDLVVGHAFLRVWPLSALGDI